MRKAEKQSTLSVMAKVVESAGLQTYIPEYMVIRIQGSPKQN